MRHRRHCGTGVELARIKPGQCIKVCRIEGGWRVRQRLNQMGVHIGDVMCVKQTGAFRGPMLIEIHGTRVALGCGLARKVMVEIADQQSGQND